MGCKGICVHHKALGRYAIGNKRCQICEIFIKWDAIFCPCCGYRLRNGPRLFRHKAKLRIKRKEQQIQKAQNKNNSKIILHAR